MKTALDFHLPIFFMVSTERPSLRRSPALPARKECIEYDSCLNPDNFRINLRVIRIWDCLSGELSENTKNCSFGSKYPGQLAMYSSTSVYGQKPLLALK